MIASSLNLSLIKSTKVSKSLNGRPHRLAKRFKLIRGRSKRLRKGSVSRENVASKSKRRKLNASLKISEELRKENRDSAISKRENVFGRRGNELLPKLVRTRKEKKVKISKMRRRAMRSMTKKTTKPSTKRRRKKTSLMLRSKLLKTTMMTPKVKMMALNRKHLVKKLMIKKMPSNLKRMPKKIPEPQMKIPCQLSLRDVALDQNRMLNSDVTKKQRVVVVVVVVGENVLKWSIGLKSKLQQKPTLMLRMLRETSKKSVQKIKKRTPRLKLMQL